MVFKDCDFLSLVYNLTLALTSSYIKKELIKKSGVDNNYCVNNVSTEKSASSNFVVINQATASNFNFATISKS